MELNTPCKNPPPPRTTANNPTATGTPVSQFENSPVFNYINNLSPIDLVRSTLSDQTFSSLSFTSPSPGLSSPQFGPHADAKSSIKRHTCQFLDVPKSKLPQSNKGKKVCEDVPEGDKLSDLRAIEGYIPGSSGEEISTELPNQEDKLAVDSPEGLKCNYGSPDGHMVPVDVTRRHSGPEMPGNLKERSCSYDREKELRRIGRNGENEYQESDWTTFISDVSNIFNFDPSINDEDPEEQKIVDPLTMSFISNVLGTVEAVVSGGSSEQCEMGEPQIQSVEYGEQKVADRVSVILPDTLRNTLVATDATANGDAKGKSSSQSTSKQLKIRRRCLNFETSGAHKKKPIGNSSGSYVISSQPDSEGAPREKHLTQGKTGRSDTPSMVSQRGIGLHLNSLATTSNNGKVVKSETLASGDKEINFVSSDNTVELMEESPSTMNVSEEYGISSPKMKRQRVEHLAAACKRCNCKRSKCLKLYCECFAAGLYCIEPCSCQDCFNTPAHEDTVLETRKQIESRNPLAFAPKVIRSADFVSEDGDDSNKTPASARHKRGCNCKKSSCLKKYCECFQGGVGCSDNCRCEGCKNTFGSKNGLYIAAEEHEHEDGESEAPDKKSDATLDDTELPIPPETARSFIQLPFHGKLLGSSPSSFARTLVPGSQKLGIGRMISLSRQPKFETRLEAIPEDETPEILTGSGSHTSVKSTSPNCKRVSPPHHGFGTATAWKSSRKLILKSIPPFPPLNSAKEQ